MAQENDQLESLTRGNLELEPIKRQCSNQMDIKYWKTVGPFATSLYRCLMLLWPCQCRISQKASLLLDIRANSKENKEAEAKFRVIFYFDDKEGIASFTSWHWRDTEIRSLEVCNEWVLASSFEAITGLFRPQVDLLSPVRPSTVRNASFVAPPLPPSRTPSPVSLPKRKGPKNRRSLFYPCSKGRWTWLCWLP